MEISEMSLPEKLIQLRRKVPYIKKEQKDYIRFSVVSSENVLKEFNTHMNTLNLLLTTEVLNTHIKREQIGTNQKTNKTIFSYLIQLDMKYTWINGDKPSERKAIQFSAIADDENSSYAYGQALTYAEKTFFMKEFNIPADDVDPDVFQKEILKRIPATDEQKEAVRIQMAKLEELTGQPQKAFLEQAKMADKVAAGKAIDDFTGYDFGLVSNTLTGWVNGYEKQKAKAEKEQKAKK